jgi:hypothetical protein
LAPDRYRRLNGEATTSGNVGGGFPVPFLTTTTNTTTSKGRTTTTTTTNKSYKWNSDNPYNVFKAGDLDDPNYERKLWGALAGYKPEPIDTKYAPTAINPKPKK